MTRPALPVRHANPHVQATLNSGILPPVKYQILSCQGQDILVGRLKIETPTQTGHAFILRRYDTKAVSLTTMFRAAFPNAPEPDEKAEVQWVKDHFDLSGNNGSSKEPHITRLAGVWVSPEAALTLGKHYGLGEIINTVVTATPDPNGNYRRSGKQTANTTAPADVAPSAVTSSSANKPPSKSLPTPSPTNAGPAPAKRRKESSPVPVPVPRRSASPAKPSAATTVKPTPRRSTRTKSPTPASQLPSFTSIVSTKKTPPRSKGKVAKSPNKSKKVEALTPGGSDETAVEEEGDSTLEERVMGDELHQQDIREQKELIANLKAKRDAARNVAVEDQEQDVDMQEETNLKRSREQQEEAEELRFEFKQPEVEERAIATNRRVGRFEMEPRTKSFAWGVAAFALGMGAVSLLPSFF